MQAWQVCHAAAVCVQASLTCSISPDAIGDPDRAGSDGGATYYRAIIVAEPPVQREGMRKLEILPGMTGTADIRTGERSVLDFIIRPMMRSQEAFRER